MFVPYSVELLIPNPCLLIFFPFFLEPQVFREVYVEATFLQFYKRFMVKTNSKSDLLESGPNGAGIGTDRRRRSWYTRSPPF